jgi:acyl-CoA synthetase
MQNDPYMKTADLTTLRIAQSGSERVPYKEAAEFEDQTGAIISQFYGSTESGCVSGPTVVEESQEVRLGTAGRMIPEMNIRLFDEDGRDVTADGRGQCGVKGPATCPGYFDDSQANARLFRSDGWLLLGDIVELENGYVKVVGRVSDFIIRGGLNISAGDVEDGVRRHSRVEMATAVSMPDPIMGERVCVYVVTTDRRALGLEDLREFLSGEGVPKSLWPERIEVVDELPVVSGKVAKAELRHAIRRRLAAEAETGQ